MVNFDLLTEIVNSR